MVRQGKFRHNVIVTGVNDGTKQVSKDAWNDDLNVAGMFGHTATTLTIATGSITPVNDMHKIDGEGALDDDLTTIDNTNTAEFDEMWLLGGAQVITIKNSGNIVTLTGLDVVLSTTIPTKLIRIGTSWYEVGASGGGIFPDTSFAIQDDGDISKQMLVSLGGASAGFDTTLTFIQTADRAITFPDATTTLVGLSVANAYGDFLQTFKDNKFKINSPDDADGVIFVNSDQTADRNLTIPVLTGDDTLSTLGLAQTNSGLKGFSAGLWVTSGQKINLDSSGAGDTYIYESSANVMTFVQGGSSYNLSTINPVGIQDVFIPAGAMWARTTSGAGGLTKVETSTNKINYNVWEFDTTTQEYVQFTWIPPRNYNNGTVKFTFWWTNASGLSTETVDWNVAGIALRNDDVIDTALGTAVTTTDTWLAQNDIHISPQSTAVTIGGTVQDSDFILFEISRKTSTDNMTGDARLIGVVLEYTIDSATSA